MGGSKERDVPSNIIVLCSTWNNRLEADAAAAEMGREWGWKLRPGDNPANVPVYYFVEDVWYYLDDDYNRIKGDK
jgi:hypothetical protein